MYADQLLPPQRELPALDVYAVTTEQTRSAFAEIMSVSFDIPHSVCQAVYGSERAWDSELSGYVGYANGIAIFSACLTRSFLESDPERDSASM